MSIPKLLSVAENAAMRSSSSCSSSTKPKHVSKPKGSLVKALRVLDLISPNRRNVIAATRQTHLRLIQDFLGSESNQNGSRFPSNDFAVPSTFFTKMIESDPLTSQLHMELRKSETNPNVLSNALSSCVYGRNLRSGVQHHCVAIKSGFLDNIYVGSSLITMYAKCGELDNAHKAFVEMPVRNVVSWTAIISAFAQEWNVDMCLGIYHHMRLYSNLKPNDFTLASILSACSGSGSLGQGRSVHCQTVHMSFDLYTHVSNALISMYGKCGSVKEALSLFRNMDSKDIVSWNSMIIGYAQHGLAIQAIDLFKEMEKEKSLKPDAITFLGILSSCRHAGFVNEAWYYLNLMVEHGLKPEIDHYSCIVDLLSRAGLLEEALEFIEKMPISPNSVIWGSVLSSCRTHGNIMIGIRAAERRLLMEPGCATTHVQLANLYARAGFWDNAAKLRLVMKDKGLKTSVGYSWIEIKNEVHRFRVEDKSNARIDKILEVMGSLVDHMQSLGHGFEVDEEEISYSIWFDV